MKDGAAAILGIVISITVAAVVIFGGWQLGWWFTKQNVDRTYQVNTHSQGYVQAQVDHLRNLDEGYNATTDAGQQAQIRNEFCAIYHSLVQDAPGDIAMDATHIGC